MKMSLGRRFFYAFGAPLLAAIIALVVATIVMLISGSNPIEGFGDMAENATRLETIIDMLNRATPLYISAVAAAIGFRMNLFNIGVEGQYLLAAFFAASVGGSVTLPAPLHIALVLITAVVIGASYSGVAGLLKVTRGVNEVISTIMLNGIAISGILVWLVRAWADDSGASNNIGSRVVPESGRIPDLNGAVEVFTREISKGRRLTGVLLIAAAVGLGYHVLINRTRFGYDLRASGWNPFAAQVGGVPPRKMIFLAMVFSGGIAGLVGMVEILSTKFKYDQSFVQGLGFSGIGVALLGRNHPGGMVFAALLFALLDVSSGVLQISGSASREIVIIIQGVILLAAVVAYEIVRRIRERDEARLTAEAMRSDSKDAASSASSDLASA